MLPLDTIFSIFWFSLYFFTMLQMHSIHWQLMTNLNARILLVIFNRVSYFFFCLRSLRLEKFTLKVNKWVVWGSNCDPCIYYELSLTKWAKLTRSPFLTAFYVTIRFEHATLFQTCESNYIHTNVYNVGCPLPITIVWIWNKKINK